MNGPDIEDYRRLMAGQQLVWRSNRKKSGRNKQPLVSIVTVVLNRERTIRDAIQSVISQTHKNIEYIIIDGGSTDRTLEIVRDFKDKVSVVWTGKDKGISDAFNRGIALATGEYIGLLNSDDWFEPDTVANVVRGFEEHPEVVAVCGSMWYWRNEEREVLFPSRAENLRADMTINHPTTFVKRSAYEEAGVFRTDFRFVMDFELFLRFQKRGWRTLVMQETLANMRFDGASDRNWFALLMELRRAQKLHYPRSIRLALHLYWKVVRAVSGRLLAGLGMNFILRFYRTRVSSFRRTYAR